MHVCQGKPGAGFPAALGTSTPTSTLELKMACPEKKRVMLTAPGASRARPLVRLLAILLLAGGLGAAAAPAEAGGGWSGGGGGWHGGGGSWSGGGGWHGGGWYGGG